jgi:hypothetical protein
MKDKDKNNETSTKPASDNVINKEPKGKDIFIKEYLYKDGKNIFSFDYKNIAEVKNDCLVVLDTNVLLLPYKAETQSISEIEGVYKKLKKEQRLFIPVQAAKEFIDHRSVKVGEVFHNILDQKSRNSNPSVLKSIPILENEKAYKKIKKLEKEIADKIKEISKNYDELSETVLSWSNWSDPISLLYKNLFTPEIIIDPVIDKESFKTEIEKRFFHEIPPGYKDGGKPDDGVGDLLIWKTILYLGEIHNKNLIFVSGDTKIDWCIRNSKTVIAPRPELINEYRCASGGKSFYFIQLSQLLKMFDASEEVIDDIKHEESISYLSKNSINENLDFATQINRMRSIGDKNAPNRGNIINNEGLENNITFINYTAGSNIIYLSYSYKFLKPSLDFFTEIIEKIKLNHNLHILITVNTQISLSPINNDPSLPIFIIELIKGKISFESFSNIASWVFQNS